MADEIETELRALMDKAPLTPTPDEEAAGQIEQEQNAQEASQGASGGSQADQQPAEGSASDASKAAPAEPSEEAKKHIDNMKAQAREEREKRRAAEARAEQTAAQLAQMEANMRQMMAQVQASQNRAPDPEVDVVGALKYTQQQLAEAQQRQQLEAARQAEISRQMSIARKIETTVEDYENEFKAEHPDYDDALDHVLDLKEAEFVEMGFSTKPIPGHPKGFSPAQVAAANWAMNAAAHLINQGKNPAEAGYTLAKRMGFAGKAPLTQQIDPAQQAAQAGAQKLQQIKDGQAAGSKMSGGGNSSNFDGSLKAGVALEGAAFDAWAERFLRQQTRG